MKLSEHFTVEEFEHSDTAKAKGISNKMNEAQLNAVKHFCVYVLENIRKYLTLKYGKVSIKITSGFRGPLLNKAVGGSNTSQHSCNNGCAAADFHVYKIVNDKSIKLTSEQVFQDIKTMLKEGKVSVDQLILEITATAKWVHVGSKGQLKDNRKQTLLYKNGKYSNY